MTLSPMTATTASPARPPTFTRHTNPTPRHHRPLAQHLVRSPDRARPTPESERHLTTSLHRFFACIPAIVGGSIWAYKLEADHHHHLEHLKEENGGELPHPPAYEYLNIRCVAASSVHFLQF